MTNSLLLRLLLFLFALLSQVQASTNNQQIETKTLKLKTIRTEMVDVQSALATTKRQYDTLQKSLKAIEMRAGKLSAKMQTLNDELELQHQNIKDLHEQQKQLHDELKSQQHVLAKQLRAAYLTGKQPFVKILLNQQQAVSAMRMMRYYRYLSKPLQDTIQANNEILQQLTDNEQQIKKKTKKLKKLKKEYQHQQGKLQQQLNARAQILTQIQGHIHNKELRIGALQDNISHLQGIINSLKLAPQQSLYVFDNLKAKLTWPTAGNITLKFAEADKAHGALHSNGVVLQAPAGQVVHAVSDGEVVFADWLKGYGLLLIIDHGDGFMSLYGRNQSLLKRSGEPVHRGDVVAHVGNSGGFAQDALYFEIRDHGVAKDPALWCTS